MTGTGQIRLSALDAGVRFQVSCCACGRERQEDPRDLVRIARIKSASLTELETALSCLNRQCRGPVRVSLVGERLISTSMRGAA